MRIFFFKFLLHLYLLISAINIIVIYFLYQCTVLSFLSFQYPALISSNISPEVASHLTKYLQAANVTLSWEWLPWTMLFIILCKQFFVHMNIVFIISVLYTDVSNCFEKNEMVIFSQVVSPLCFLKQNKTLKILWLCF